MSEDARPIAAPDGDAREQAATERRARRERRRRIRRWLRRALGAAVLLLLLAIAALVQTGPGHRLALNALLDVVRGALAGDLLVEEIRSGSLLTGATLSGVRLLESEGTQVVAADSIQIKYWPLGFMTGRPRLRSVVLWGLDVNVVQDAPGGVLNVDRLFVRREGAADSTSAASQPIEIGQVGVREGTVQVLKPGPTSAAGVERLAFDGVDLDLEEVVLDLGGARGRELLEARLASLSTDVSFPAGDGAMELYEAFGRVTFGAAGIQVTEGAFRLPGTLLRGRLGVGPQATEEGWTLQADLEVDGSGDLADLLWIDPRVPSGSFRGGATLASGRALNVDLRGVDIQLAASSLTARGGVSFGSTMSMRSLVVTASPLAISRLEPWLGREIPLDGWLSGQVTFGGSFEDLQATGRVTVVPTGLGGTPTTAEFSGTIHGGEEVGFTDVALRLDELNYGLVQAFVPGVLLVGTGSGSLELDGMFSEAVAVVADFTYRGEPALTSRAVARGSVRRSESGEWTVDVRGDLLPLSVGAMDAVLPDLGLRGAVSGPVHVVGPLGDLQVMGELQAGEGSLLVDGAVDLLAPGSRYRLDAKAAGLSLSDYSVLVPDRSEWSGSISIEGRGVRPDSLEARATFAAYGSRVGGLGIDTLWAVLGASGGVLTADTVVAALGGVTVNGHGRFGIAPDALGEAHFAFASPSLIGLRPLLLGDSIRVRDGLSSLDEELLRLEGIDPDSLPTAAEVRMTGALRGTAELRGTLSDFDLETVFDLAGGGYGPEDLDVDTAHVVLFARGLPELRGRWEIDLQAAGVSWQARTFDRVVVAGSMAERRGQASVELGRNRTERYTATGEFAIDSTSGQARLTEASARLDEHLWSLSAPAQLSWTPGTLAVDSLDVDRLGPDPMHLLARGTLARGGASDFRLDVEGLHLEQLSRIAQVQDLQVAGHLDLGLTLSGPAENPRIGATLGIEDPRFANVALTRVEGSLEYEERVAQVRVEAWNGGRSALTLVGTVPLDLSLADVPSRRLDAPMNLRIAADSLEAAVALAYVGALEDVAGTVSADVQILGTPLAPELTGSARLEGGAWTIEALGVRHQGVSGTLIMTADQDIEVALETRVGGFSRVSGTIHVSPLADPALALEVDFQRFQAMRRRDMEGFISGAITVSGTYQRPLVEGSVTVDEGILYVDEFARAVDVIDLTDPRLFRQSLAVDTTAFLTQPLIADLRNPFFDNLRVNVAMAVPRNTWLRSDDMNVEMGGDLIVRYDRNRGDFVLVGELLALRGTYRFLGRTFEVDEGTVGFIGTPGVNPTLNIQARTRIRTPEQADEPIEILATVEGTLIQPVVTLTSETGDLAQSDLISYLVFGRPNGLLGSGQASAIAGLGGEALSGAVTQFYGALASQVGAAIARNFEALDLDYLNISLLEETGQLSSGGGRTQLEAGRYLGQDVFVVLIYRPLSNPETEGINRFGGARVEWAMTDDYTVQGFVEDRFLRSGTGSFGGIGLGGQRIIGLLVFREWGYN